jgi:hypothetical protein
VPCHFERSEKSSRWCAARRLAALGGDNAARMPCAGRRGVTPDTGMVHHSGTAGAAGSGCYCQSWTTVKGGDADVCCTTAAQRAQRDAGFVPDASLWCVMLWLEIGYWMVPDWCACRRIIIGITSGQVVHRMDELFTSISIWKSGGVRARHKPLLLLYALGRYRNGSDRLIPYRTVDRDLSRLLGRFAELKTPPRTYYPFWRLQNDGIWEIERSELISTNNQGDASKRDLDRYNVRGGLTLYLYHALVKHPQLMDDVANKILGKFFTPDLITAVLQSVGLCDVSGGSKRFSA